MSVWSVIADRSDAIYVSWGIRWTMKRCERKRAIEIIYRRLRTNLFSFTRFRTIFIAFAVDWKGEKANGKLSAVRMIRCGNLNSCLFNPTSWAFDSRENQTNEFIGGSWIRNEPKCPSGQDHFKPQIANQFTNRVAFQLRLWHLDTMQEYRNHSPHREIVNWHPTILIRNGR